MKDGTKEAIVLKVGERFYNSHTSKRVITAWALAGANLFLEGSSSLKISDVEEMLKEKGYNPIRKVVRLVD
jgi:hypothetical protein